MDLKDGSVKLNWNAYLAEEKRQDARTSFENARKFIEMLQKKGYIPRGGKSVLYIHSDGCPIQYKCTNALKSLIWLSHHYGFVLDVMINCAHHVSLCCCDQLLFHSLTFACSVARGNA